jgi:glycosyltransferase involved in cell wall biosynthesis
MKVCLVGPAYPYRGGIAHFTTLLANEFAGDHGVSIINFKRLYPDFLFPGKTQYDESESPLQVDSHRLIDTLNPFSFIAAGRAIGRLQPELVVFQWWHPFFAFAYCITAFLLKRLCRARVVFLCHNVLPHEASVFDRLLIKIGFFQADAFLVQSGEDRANLEHLKKQPRVDLHPHPIYDVFKRGEISRQQARERLGVEEPMLLFFGYIRPYKGLNTLLEAFAQVLPARPSRLFVVGEFYEDQAPYLQTIERLGLGDRISLVDRYVPNEEVELYFAACDLVVLPYLSATQSGIVQIAFGFDKPVVVTEVGGLPDVVDHGRTGYVVPPNRPDALARAIVDFFDQDKAAEFSVNIQAAKERFSWTRCIEKLIKLGRADLDREM